MMYSVYYKHSFAGDVFFAFSKKQAKKKALKILEQEFKGEEFPLNGTDYGEPFIVNSLEELIEEIVAENIFSYYWNLLFNN